MEIAYTVALLALAIPAVLYNVRANIWIDELFAYLRRDRAE